MGMEDLFTALNAFKSGVNELQTSRVIQGANDQVQQIKSSEASDADKRMQLTSLSQQLVGQMGALHAPVDQTQQQAANVAPKQYANANAMNQDALLTGNAGLQGLATKDQSFENNKAFTLAMIKAQSRNNPLALAQADEKKNEFNVKQLSAYGKNLDDSAASSRTQFGQWAATAGKGDRATALLGDPGQWKNMSPINLQLAADVVGNMANGGVVSKEEHAALMPFQAGIKAAQIQYAATGKMPTLDLSGMAGIYSNITQREGNTAKEKTFDNIMDRVNQGAELGKRPGAEAGFRSVTASALGKHGINVDPNTISIDPKSNKVVIPELKPMMDAVNQAPTAVRKAMAEAKTGNADAINFLKMHHISPEMSPSAAIEQVKSNIKQSLFR